MKRFLKVFLPILLSVTILCGIGWYLFFYDTQFTVDVLLNCAEYFENRESTTFASWFYDCAIARSDDPDSIAINTANKYLEKGKYTSAEVALNKVLAKGGSPKVYMALCKVYAQQDKLLDAVNLLDNISDPKTKAELDQLRPSAPVPDQPAGEYNTYIPLSFLSEGNTVYVTKEGQYPSVSKNLFSEPIVTSAGVNDFYAVSIAPNGLVSTLANYTYKIESVIEAVTFTDPTIETAVRNHLKIPAETSVMTSDLWKLRSFTVPTGTVIYSDLAQMTNLESVIIETGSADQLKHLTQLKHLKELSVIRTLLSAEDLEAVSKITTLNKLTLQYCMLSTVAPLSSLQSLEYLNLSTNSIRDIDALGQLPNLKELYLHQNALMDLSALSNCTTLRVLDLSDNGDIHTLEPISELVKLEILNISNTNTTDISCLSKMTKLKEFYAKSNAIASIACLENAPNLERINISGNIVSDLSPLSAHTQIISFEFSKNIVTTLPQWDKECSLQLIDGSDNQIKDLSPLSGLVNLKNILMNNNSGISKLEFLLECPALIEVQVYDTNVKKAEAEKLIEPEPPRAPIVVYYAFTETKK